MEKGKNKKEENLEDLLKGLKLSKEERSGRPPQAVGKLFSVKQGSAEGIVQSLGKIWCPVKGIKCKYLGDNLFLFTFLQPGGKRRAVTEGPWVT
jgi:hypothetical protein